MITDIIQTNIQQRIKSSTGSIPESTDRYPPGEKRDIKKVNDLQDELSQPMLL